MKRLKDYILEDIDDEFDPEPTVNPLDYNELKEKVNLALVGDIKMYTEDGDFRERKEAIANSFKQKLSITEVNVDRIKKTKIFEYYIMHLLQAYKKNIDENMKLNVSSENELRHQLATDIILLIKDQNTIE
jgi:hypothetical protein